MAEWTRKGRIFPFEIVGYKVPGLNCLNAEEDDATQRPDSMPDISIRKQAMSVRRDKPI